MNTTTLTTALPYLHLSPATEMEEWEHAWGKLAAFWGDHANYNAAYSESWQYMGTELRADTWEHVFRHRIHPVTNKREYWRTPATDAYHKANAIPKPIHKVDLREFSLPRFTESICAGAFDGISVTSDADSGL